VVRAEACASNLENCIQRMLSALALPAGALMAALTAAQETAEAYRPLAAA
jgi:hypothetical protein